MLHDRTKMTPDNVTSETLARWHDHAAQSAMQSLSCGSENSDYRVAGYEHGRHRAAAKLIRELAGIALLAGMDY